MAERKRISISDKRQITIPQKFFTMLGFGTEAECILKDNEIVIRPIESQSSGEFAEQILADLIEQGYSGSELLNKFKEKQNLIRPAVEKMIDVAKQTAYGNGESSTYDDIFDVEE